MSVVLNQERIADSIYVGSNIATVHHLADRVSSSFSCRCEHVVKPDHLPAVVEQLQRTGGEGAWAVFMFETDIPSVDTTDDYLNLQYCIEQGVVGLEWVLLGPRNIADKKRLMDFMKHHGHKVVAREMNDVAYLRVKEGSIIQLGLNIVRDFYSMPKDAAMGLLVSGFQLPPDMQLPQ